MPRATLRLTIPDGVWVGDLSRRHASARFRILAALTGEESGVGLAEVTSERLPAVVEAMRDADDVTELTVLQQRDTTALVQFETTMPLLLLPVRDSGIPLEMPFDIEDGEATWELTAPRERLSELGRQLEAFGIPFTVESVRQRPDVSSLLTERQEAMLEAAVDHGYYDTPRTCSLTELAADQEVAKSTCSEILHRAEGKVIKRFLDQREQGSALRDR
ncbi:helix-turn-helix domain-containing protein [Halorarius halobius]|uniref:helix-turn-helix domain-containing protein n=1 Tax=Halorarius halobius TaxID=2962671 RepID=UPI0020CED16E|nr:helix-turn-helix domain-containing protein [Halorarius halobius]